MSYEETHKLTKYECDCGKIIIGFDAFSEHIKKHLEEIIGEDEERIE